MWTDILLFTLLNEWQSESFEYRGGKRVRRSSYLGKIWNTYTRLDGLTLHLDFHEGDFLKRSGRFLFIREVQIARALIDDDCGPPEDTIGYFGAAPNLKPPMPIGLALNPLGVAFSCLRLTTKPHCVS